MNFYIQLYGKLEKQIKKSCWMLEINKAVSQKWICRGADSKKNVWAIMFQRFLLGSTSFKIQYWASLWLSGKEAACQCRRLVFDPWVKETPWRRKWQLTPVFLPGKSQGWRNLVGCSLWGHKKSDTTEQLTLCIFKDLFSHILLSASDFPFQVLLHSCACAPSCWHVGTFPVLKLFLQSSWKMD